MEIAPKPIKDVVDITPSTLFPRYFQPQLKFMTYYVLEVVLLLTWTYLMIATTRLLTQLIASSTKVPLHAPPIQRSRRRGLSCGRYSKRPPPSQSLSFCWYNQPRICGSRIQERDYECFAATQMIHVLCQANRC
jgi:hypothetical protein